MQDRKNILPREHLETAVPNECGIGNAFQHFFGNA